MNKPIEPCYYGDYLKLDQFLDAQKPVSGKYGEQAHDETLFIIVHQAYELWFKQILHELSSVIDIFKQKHVAEQDLTTVVHRLKRVVKIQHLINDQIDIIETMTPQDFLDFRNYLVPASGFQSIQFKVLEISLGLKSKQRIDFDKQSFYNRLTDEHRKFLEELEGQASLFEVVEQWLERLPFLNFGEFNFWQNYQDATQAMLDEEKQIIETNAILTELEKRHQLKEHENTRANFNALLDAKRYQEAQANGRVRLSQQATLSALFISMYREQPLMNLPFQFLTLLTEIDEALTLWRYKHMMMVQRMLGTKIGTGGSSGHDYLRRTTENNRVFTDFYNLATFLLPKTKMPALPESVKKALSFSY
ncbi:tryptophan 2,3-dioxygenase [Thalassotalea sp. LPB0316]|uniref:tryptophan 2,3-dioxygenase family protein n=1 Tax=Thalassotalea sp. LPB0316 TaxID=2769490 RepID=UPI001868F1DE|nr:tryptophan 2,3-dioxygenase family protein [Thalassotalea sp. LPB0316]QOL27151.1 tryptophan 2,3-dioxygenase [Thalassotalea sp. LPB0316]